MRYFLFLGVISGPMSLLSRPWKFVRERVRLVVGFIFKFVKLIKQRWAGRVGE